ncbi:MAG: GIY-YIG nuclease family protein [Balneolaceae bacterium]|jgi:putative endonuclease
MYTVYALYSPNYDKIYIGYTTNLEQRLLSHNDLGTKGWTIAYRPWELVYSEEHESKAEAMKREKQLKSAKGRQFVWDLIHENRA